jgi:hypothetical protein
MVSQGPQQEHGYRNTRWMDKLEGTGLWHESYRNPFASARKLKAATTTFPGQKCMVISRLKKLVSEHAVLQ